LWKFNKYINNNFYNCVFWNITSLVDELEAYVAELKVLMNGHSQAQSDVQK